MNRHRRSMTPRFGRAMPPLRWWAVSGVGSGAASGFAQVFTYSGTMRVHCRGKAISARFQSIGPCSNYVLPSLGCSLWSVAGMRTHLERRAMTQTSSPATSVNAGDLLVGAVINRSRSMLWRHFPRFFVVGVIASSPILLLAFAQGAESEDEEILGPLLLLMFSLVALMALSTIGQAVVIHAALQDMRRRPVRLVESLNVALRSFWPLIGLALASLLIIVGLALLIVPGLVLSTLWFVVLPVCMVEQLGPRASLRRSVELTRGHRWKVLGLTSLLMVGTFVGSWAIESWVTAVTGPIVGSVGDVMWTAVWTAFTATTAIVTYQQLRLVKEGTDIEQIAVVFE